MKRFSNKISNLLDQITLVDNMILLQKSNNDQLMFQQYQARKIDYLKELVSELIQLSASTPRIRQIIKTIISQIETITPVVKNRKYPGNLSFRYPNLKQ